MSAPDARSGDTFVEELPPHETGPVPVHVQQAKPRLVEAAERLKGGASSVAKPAREILSYTAETLLIRTRTERELLRRRADVRRLLSGRELLLCDLGDAVYRGDDEATEALRARIGALDETIERLEAEMQATVAEAESQIQDARLGVQETMIERPDIPEPYPPPGELDPPSPPDIPEPYPPPGETDPPAPPQIPEPYPPSEPEPS